MIVYLAPNRFLTLKAPILDTKRREVCEGASRVRVGGVFDARTRQYHARSAGNR